MVFASYEFVFVFLPVVAAVYFLLGKISTIRIQHLFLVLASLFFYGYFNVSYLWIILSSIVVNYGIAVSMQRVDVYKRQVCRRHLTWWKTAGLRLLIL